MLDIDDDLPTLIRRHDHLNVLRFLRVHQIRDPALVVRTGQAWLGESLDKTPKSAATGGGPLAILAALEQICLAALDVGDATLAQLCLKRLQESGGTTNGGSSFLKIINPAVASAGSASMASTIDPETSVRFRLLQGRCLEAAADYDGATLLYDELLQENPSNLQALRRQYCVHKAQVGRTVQAVTALNNYLQHNSADTAAWYELARMRQELGDYDGAVFGLEEVLLAVPTDAKLHVELAECLVTAASTNTNNPKGSSSRLEALQRARQHMAQALELDPTNRRAQFGLVTVSNAYLVAAAAAGAPSSAGHKKGESVSAALDDHDVAVAEELVRYGAEQVLQSYQGSPLSSQVRRLMDEYTDGLM